MKILLTLLIFSLTLISCRFNTECENGGSLLGRYILDFNSIASFNNNDTTISLKVQKNGWNKIVLIVEKNKYHFEECEEYFRKYEGFWEYKQMSIEGDCYIFIYQKEGSLKLPLGSFNIGTNINNEFIVLPFKKSL